MTDPTRYGPRSTALHERRGWLPVAAFVFVLVSLIALAAIPGVVLNRVTTTTEEIATLILPANDALRDLAFALEERVVASRSRFLTDDPRYDTRLAQAKASEQAALRTLADLAPKLGVSLTRQIETLRKHTATRDSIEDSIVVGAGQVEAYLAAIPRFDAIRDSMLIEVNDVRMELMRAAQVRAADEAQWADLQRALSMVLGTMALVAAVLVGWFAWREGQLRREIQSALDEATRQRLIAERRGLELARAAEARARLLRGVTHDVKNPLGAAKGYAELLEMGVKAPMLPQQVPLVEGVIRSIDGALALIADLLDLARADSGGLAVRRTNVDLSTVACEAVEGHRSAAEAAGLSLEVHPASAQVTIHTDPVRVGQVLGNLISNAIKYTPSPGRITVRCELRDETDAGSGVQWAVVRVHDTGPGIAPDQRDAIFDEFTRLDDAGPQQGHGLGLSIARRIARLLGGDLTVEDAAGGGSSFVLLLPLRDEDILPSDDRPAEANESKEPSTSAI